MPRMPLRPPILNPEHLLTEGAYEFTALPKAPLTAQNIEAVTKGVRFKPGTCTSGALVGDNCKAADCPEHGLFSSPHLGAGFVSLERQTQMRAWKDSRGMPVTQWPQQLLPSATVIIVENIENYQMHQWKMLIHQRADNGFWGFVGGRQEIGESIQECAVREAKEETGLDVELEYLTSIDSHPEYGSIVCYPDGNAIQYTNMTFVARAISGVLRCSEESTGLQWCVPDNLCHPFLPSHAWRLQQARSMNTALELRFIR